MAIIEKVDGTRFNLTEYGVPILKVGPVDIIYNSENVTGRPGRNRVTRYHGIRKLQLKMLVEAKNISDTELLTEVLAEIFDDAEDFYIYQQLMTESYGFELPGQTSFESALGKVKWTQQMYKCWRVERINNDAIEWNGLRGKRVIEFETSDLPYATTPFTSLQLLEKAWDIDKIAWGMSFDWDESPPQFSFSTNNFNLKNYGNVKIDPRYMPLKITLKGNFASFVQITNVATGDVFRLNGSLAPSDTLVLDGVSYLKNGQHVTGQTNKKLISLKKGNNQFTITGGTVSSISFDFPFYYL
ncbi:phage tail domain-containing protein [Metasolibacillus meyeri]|uniref:phage tail domain-containing protein n=1 Tax=Metasolibacillus meyeri TaxID=1071052 RepID=UPI000D3185D7|nr:phage tail domain-containing protein [Metasolibacillus meyeri]